MLDRLRGQTAQIRDESGKTPLGTCFFVDGENAVTAEHCVCVEKLGGVRAVSFYRDGEELCKGRVRLRKNGVAFIDVPQGIHVEDCFPVGYCRELGHGDDIDIYGYPQRQPRGYNASMEISQNFEKDAGGAVRPNIQCLVRNKEGGLDLYEGLSGSPAVAWGHVVGIVAMEDLGGQEPNAIHILDFTLVQGVFEDAEVAIREIHRPPEEKAEGQRRADRTSLYKQAWWLTRSTSWQGGKGIQISDRYSIILATLLLGMHGGANVILASPWECGLAERLREETARYGQEYPGWEGRTWLEYEGGRFPDWEKAEENSGIVISICAEDYSNDRFCELLAGRRMAGKDVLALWNIWSGQPGQAVSQAARAASCFLPGERNEVLTVFGSWQEVEQAQRASHALWVGETANEWLESQDWEGKDMDGILWELSMEEIDLLVWEMFQRNKNKQTDWGRGILGLLKERCSESMRAFLSFCGGGGNPESLLQVEPAVLKRWFAGLEKESCNEILPYLRRKRNQAPYWKTVISNSHCTGEILRERCVGGRGELVDLIFNQDTDGCKDTLLCDEAENIRRQIRPI